MKRGIEWVSQSSLPFKLALALCFTALAAFAWWQHSQTTNEERPSPARDQTRTRLSMIEEMKSWEPAIVEASSKDGGESFRQWYISQTTGLCSLHKIQMDRVWRKVVYGLPDLRSMPSKNEADAYFPHPDEGFVLGGCVVEPILEHEVFICAKCTDALKEWTAKHVETHKTPEASAVEITPR